MLFKTWKYALLVTAGLVCCTGFAGSAVAETDFAGQRITVTVPYAAGGGADLYARFLTPLIAERLPGQPTIVIKNVEGAGAIAGSNQFEQRAKKDGTDIIAASASVMLNFTFKDQRAQYNLDKWIPIISSAQGTVVYMSSALGIKTADELPQLEGKDVTLGANNPTGGDMRVLMAMDLLGVKVRPVFGLNRGDAFPAFERGELNLDFAINNAYQKLAKPLVDSGEVVPLFTLGFADDNGKVVRDPANPDLPHFLEVYEKLKGEPLSGPARKAWDSVFNLNVMATRAILLPEGTPDEVVTTYEGAVSKLLADFEADPALKKKATDLLGEEPQATGEAATRNVRSAVVFDDEALGWLRSWLKQRFDASL
ncbi:tricarboxylate transporter [Shinella sp. CPCC 100929]|uniref:Tricarboxylate transporter n=1 Tax=Shinella lacus TaxID=2654216 RepID=A0ABT1QZP4_9HYPH|nr:tricarboxylate transporter [Shinella lacus]MCQ4628400.1 tricarboxylate transporter [Shinella lacus]